MSHITNRLMLLIGALFAASLLYSTPAAAQATRTWISGVGDDVNPCSRTAPCKTFAGAISKTAAGGEINCLDPGGFGAVTITERPTRAPATPLRARPVLRFSEILLLLTWRLDDP